MNQNQNSNPYRNLKVEFHILQSFPVTCLNRDDVGAPKTAVVGGTTRARVSSQCWKRQVRLEMRNLGVNVGTRTKLISALVANACRTQGATEMQAKECGDKIEHIFIKKPEVKKENDEPTGNDKTDTLLFFSPEEIRILAEKFKAAGFNPDSVIKEKDAKKQMRELENIFGGKPEQHVDALDIALFGRMVAQAATMNVEAAASFSHAISTHKVTNEVDFFTALDDESTEPGSAHMGSLEFNSATYYRYISLDIGQLAQTLASTNISEAVGAFIKALFIAVPNARQTTQSGYSPWEFAKVYVKKGQRLQVPFETAVKMDKLGGYLAPSKIALRDYLEKKEKLAGSLFGKIISLDFGDDETFTIDNLITSINNTILEAAKK